MIITQICYKCLKTKDLNQFYDSPSHKRKKTNLCIECIKQKYLNVKKTQRWLLHLKKAKERCNNPNYIRYKSYGGKGIKCLLTKKEIQELWYRDNAGLLKKPSLDRINPKKNYEYSNCRFIEMEENLRRRDEDKRNLKYRQLIAQILYIWFK